MVTHLFKTCQCVGWILNYTESFRCSKALVKEWGGEAALPETIIKYARLAEVFSSIYECSDKDKIVQKPQQDANRDMGQKLSSIVGQAVNGYGVLIKVKPQSKSKTLKQQWAMSIPQKPRHGER